MLRALLSSVPYVSGLDSNYFPVRFYSFKHFLKIRLHLNEEKASALINHWVETVPANLHLRIPTAELPSTPYITRTTLIGTEEGILHTLQNLRQIYPPLSSYLSRMGIEAKLDTQGERATLIKHCEQCRNRPCVFFKAWDGVWKIPTLYATFQDEEYGGWYVCRECI